MFGHAVAAIDYTRMSDPGSGIHDVNLNRCNGPTCVRTPLETQTRPSTPPATEKWVEDYLGRDVSRFFYKWGGAFSAVLVRLRGRYDGDLDQFLLHLVFMLTDLATANAIAEARAKGAKTVIRKRRGLNLLSLAEITRIPRESVRRKLAAMVERGLIVRESDGLYYPGPTSDIDRFFYTLSPLFWDGVRPG